MAKPKDFCGLSKKQRRIRYSKAFNDCGPCTASVRVNRYSYANDPLQAESVDEPQVEQLAAMVFDVITQSEEFQFLRLLMQREASQSRHQVEREPQPSDPQSDALRDYEEKRVKYARLKRPAPDDIEARKLHYQLKEQAKAEAQIAYAKVNESRKSVAQRARQYAEANPGTSWDDAVKAIGESPINVLLTV